MENEPSEGDRTDAELRTVGFRLREIQRLLSVRVQQENRRLEADGIEPVTKADFFRSGEAGGPSGERVDRQVEALLELDVFDEVSVVLADGREVRGRATPIDYVPAEYLRLELQPRGGHGVRYEVTTEYVDGEWEPLAVRRNESGDDRWTPVGTVRACRR